jgi:PadR family transcriptional regulator
VPVRDEVEKRTGRTLSSGAVYTALDRLTARGLVSSWLGEPTAERGGRRKRLYQIERPGVEALGRSVQQFRAMSRGLLPRLDALLSTNGSQSGDA